MDSAGQSRALRVLAAGRPSVVIFWSRLCGPALEALPAITHMAEGLRAAGGNILLVVTDEPPSTGLTRVLRDGGWSMPVYHDTRGEMAAAFANFGTPAYYVLDGLGRIRFDNADEAAELLSQWQVVTSGR
jgi:hypothetical protein